MPISKIETDSLASGLVAPTATALTTASGSAPSYSARAWVNFNGTGTVAIRASGNVSSITDNGTGAYTVNFTTAMPDVNYCAVGSAGRLSSSTGLIIDLQGAYATTSVFVVVLNTSLAGADSANVNVSIFR